MKILLRIILSFFTIIMLLALIITFFVVYNKYNTNDKIAYLGRYTSFISAGTSMSPSISPGNILIIKKEDNYIINDIITFRNDEGLIITHRIIDIKNDDYITKGDNNVFIDGYIVNKEDIYGKVILNTSLLTDFLKYKYYIIAFIVIIPIIMLIYRRGHHVR